MPGSPSSSSDLAGHFFFSHLTPSKVLAHYSQANPNTTPSTRKAKYTLWAEWRMMDIHVLLYRYAGAVQETGKDAVRYPPGLVDVVEAEEHAIRHPTPASEHAFHPGQEHAPEERLFAEDRVERGLEDEQNQEPPRAL